MKLLIAGLLTVALDGASQEPADRMARLIQSAHQQVGTTLSYDGRYRPISFPGGDVPIDRGVCTDVLVRDGSFDYVLCVEVLRYLPKSSPCIGEMARVLKPGGVCLATAAPQLSLNGYWLINQLTSRVKIGDMTRLKQFFTTSGRLRREFVNAGFETPSIHGVYCGPVNWAERLAPKFLPPLLKAWEPLDAVLADRFLLREFSNMFLAQAIRKS